MLCIFVLFFSLMGASDSGVIVKLEEKAVPSESFGVGRGLSGTLTDEVIEVVPKPELKNLLKSERIVNPLASGASPEGDVSLFKERALSDVIDSLDLPNIGNNGSEWNGRFIYILQNQLSDSAIIRVFDPENGSMETHWKLPFIGYCMGIAFVNNSMYVSDYSNGMIRKVDPFSHTLIASFPAPGGTAVRGITSDGEDLYIGAALNVDSVYQTDTLGNIIKRWDISPFCDYVMDLAYDTRGGAIWLVDSNANQIIYADSNGSVIASFAVPGNPAVNGSEGISFDGSDLWFNTHYHAKIYRIDGGCSHSRIALFQDHEPWLHRSIKDILYDNGIPFKVFGTADIGKVDLSIYTKAIIAGQQDREMGDAIAIYKTWWENWISNGKVLQINGATTISQSWEGLTFPGDFSCVNNSSTLQNLLEITSSWHPLVNIPYYIDDDSIDNWGYSSHGYLTGLTDSCYTVVKDTASRPVLTIKRLGDGGIIATQMTLESAWYNGYCPILENVIKYWQYGVSTNVLFAIADKDQPVMRNALTARDSLIGNVDHMDVRDYSPFLEDLNMYDVVFARTNYECLDNVAVGDTLAAYVDLGGKVIVGCFAWYAGVHLDGAIMNADYNPFYTPSGNSHFNGASLGWYDAAHPMMDGVLTFSDYFRDYLQVNPGADTVAKYSDGEYLLGFKTHPSGGLVVGFNTFVYDRWYGQKSVKLLSNTVNWSASYSGIEDVTEVKDGLAILEISSPILTDNEWLTLSIDSPASVELRIINIAGMVVSSKTLEYATPGVKRVNFDVSRLPSGLYFLSLETQKGTAIRKALVIR